MGDAKRRKRLDPDFGTSATSMEGYIIRGIKRNDRIQMFDNFSLFFSIDLKRIFKLDRSDIVERELTGKDKKSILKQFMSSGSLPVREENPTILKLKNN